MKRHCHLDALFMQRKEQLEEEFQKATDSAVKMVIQDKLKEAESEINRLKELVKHHYESKVNQYENRLQQLVTTKKEEGLFRT